MFGYLLFLFTVVPALELYLLIELGDHIGGLNTLGIVILTGVVGASFAKSQGLSVLMKIQDEVNRGGVPATEIIHGLMIFAGGLLLLTPGLMTDFVGLCLVIPLTREILSGWFTHKITKGIKTGKMNFQFFSATNGANGSQFYHYESYQDPSQSSPEQISPDVFEAEFREKND